MLGDLSNSDCAVLVGPGCGLDSDERDPDWEHKVDKSRCTPLQVQMGDLAALLTSAAYKIRMRCQPCFIVPHAAILDVERDEALIRLR